MTSKIFVQFTDDTGSTIQTSFSCAQDPDVWPNQGEIDSSDPRWKTFYDGLPGMAQPSIPAPESA